MKKNSATSAPSLPAQRALVALRKISSRLLVASCLDLSVLTQPVRLNRSRPRGPNKPPQTWRQGITESRGTWEALRQLRSLTIPAFREHLAKDFRDLPLTDESRVSHLRLLKEVPDDPHFWQVVEEALAINHDFEERPQGSKFDNYSNVWNGTYFCERFVECQKPVPRGWKQKSLDILFVFRTLQLDAEVQINERGNFLLALWRQGYQNAPIAAVQEKLPARWVEEAICTLERQQESGETQKARKQATRLLKKLEAAETKIGRGDIEHLSPEDKPKTKRQAVSRSKAIARLMSRYQKWQQPPYSLSPSEAYKRVVAHYENTTKIKDPFQVSLIRQEFRRRARRG